MISYKKYFVLTFFALASLNTSALGLLDTDKNFLKANIKSIQDYKSYRLEQLNALRNTGMNNETYLRELERLQNIKQLPFSNTTKQLDIITDDMRSFDRRKIASYLYNMKK